MTLRNAEPGDLAAIRAIRTALPMPKDATTTQGGFLLGCTDQEYLEHIQRQECLVAALEGRIIGFGILSGNAAFRTGSIWPRRQQAVWSEPADTWENAMLAYYDQLAFLPGRGRWAVGLAWAQIRHAFELGAEAIFTTTVYQPVRNLAAIPFIQAAGGRKVGQIDETYPTIGPLVSDIYVLEADAFFARAAELAHHPFLAKISHISA